MGAGQSPRRTCFQPGCFRVGVGGTRREGCVGGTCRELRRGSDCAMRIGGASGQSALLLVPAPLPCSPLTPVGMQGFLQPRTVQSRGPPGVTGARLPDRGQAVWRPAEGAPRRCPGGRVPRLPEEPRKRRSHYRAGTPSYRLGDAQRTILAMIISENVFISH